MKQLHKSLALLLCICLCAGLIPAAAAATDAGEADLSLSETAEFDAARGIVINAANFPDSVFRAFVEDNYDLDEDLVLTDEERTAVTEMDVHGLGITDLSGVEYFTGLVTLNCGENMLRALDVSGLPRLENLYCQSNLVSEPDDAAANENISHSYDRGLSELIPSSALKVLWCYNNNLTGASLHLERCPGLVDLNCSNNPLGSLDLSPVPGLLELRCNNAGLSQLDLSPVPALCVLWCWSETSQDAVALNSLEELDLSVCPKLADVAANGSLERYLYHVAYYDGESEVSVSSGVGANAPVLHLGEPYGDLNAGEQLHSDGESGDEPSSKDVVAIDEEHFPDEAFRSIVTGYDSDSNGFLSKSEIAQVTWLSVSYRDIASLQGIEYFTALTSLDCADNQLTSLDVHGCTALASLFCTDNQLTSLDVSGCTTLTTLNCGDNQLTSLNVQGCTALERLFCQNNLLPSLDVHGCPSLQQVNCNDNKLTALDVRDCPVLYVIVCNDNALTTLDFSGCPALSWLEISNNPLKTFDASTVPSLYELYCSNAKLSSLKLANDLLISLDVSRNPLETLDLTRCAKLARLTCDKTSLTKLDIGECPRLITALREGGHTLTDDTIQYRYNNDNQSMIASQLDHYYMDSPTYEITAAQDVTFVTVSSAPLRTTFPDAAFRAYVLNNLDLDQDGALSEAEILAVQELDISYQSIADLTGISLFRELRVLNCSGNKLLTLDVSGLPKLEELYCQNNYQYTPSAQAASTAAYDAAPDGVLSMADNAAFEASVTSGGLQTLTLGSAPLKVLWCYDNGLASLDLSGITTLEYLDCAYNLLPSLDVTGQPALTHLMCHDNELTTLDVSRNSALIILWCWNNSLETLDISNNPRLVEASSNHSVERFTDHVSLFDSEAEVSISVSTDLKRGWATPGGVPADASHFPDPAFREVIRAVADPDFDGVLSEEEISLVTYLDCSSREIESLEGINYLSALEHLFCQGNKLTALDVSGLPDLIELNCSYNAISSLDVSCNPALQQLRVVDNQLTALDVSANPNLKVLWCWYNDIGTLDVSASQTLSNLVMFGLTEKYSGNNQQYYDEDGNLVESGTVAYISYYDNSGVGDLSVNSATLLIAELYVAVDETNFPDEAFRARVKLLDQNGDGTLNWAEVDAVQELDCAKLGIKSLQGLEYFYLLKRLDCSGNSLTSLDLSANAALTEVDCSHNALTALNTARNPALLRLDCSYNQLAEVSFSNNYALESLDCSHNKLTLLDILDCDTVSQFVQTGAAPADASGVRSYSGSFTRDDGTVCRVSFSYDVGTALWTGVYPTPDCVLPAMLQRIESEAFSGCAFTCISLGDGISAIGEKSFANSESLLCIYIPESVKTIGSGAFDGTSALIIIGKPGSTAETYAGQNNIAFIAAE